MFKPLSSLFVVLWCHLCFCKGKNFATLDVIEHTLPNMLTQHTENKIRFQLEKVYHKIQVLERRNFYNHIQESAGNLRYVFTSLIVFPTQLIYQNKFST